MDLLYATTMVVRFCQLSKRKNYNVCKALDNGEWIGHIDMENGISVMHIQGDSTFYASSGRLIL